MREYKTPLISVDEGVGTIIDNSDIVVGSSGVVMHKFDGAQSSIIARAVVTQKGGGFAKVRRDHPKLPLQPLAHRRTEQRNLRRSNERV